MKPPARIRLRLLGRLAVTYGDDPAPVRLSTRKAGALVAYLAMSPEQTASREELATLLWGSCSDQQARQSLRQALALLRKELRWAHFLAADSAVVRLQPGLWSVDARDFEDLSKSSDPEALARAARLFGGEFLSGLNIEEEGFEEWLRGQRQRTQLAAARLCETFAARPDLVSDGEETVAAVERLLALDPLREDWQRAALTLYARYRGKSEALAQADAFAAMLQRELGVAPEKETRALVERISADEIALVSAPASAAETVPPAKDAEEAITPLTPHRTLSRRWRGAIAAAAAVAAIVVTAGLVSLSTHAPPLAKPERDARNKDVAASAPPADPWQSPRSPSHAADTPAANARKLIPILVLPFKVYGESAGSTELLADMMTDDLINMLSRIQAFRVISRQTARSYKGQSIDVAAVGAELQVRYILDGSMRMHGDMLRVNVELIDPTTKLSVWTGQITRDDADRSGVQDEIIARLARELNLEMPQIEGQRRAGDRDSVALIYKGWAAMNAAYSRSSPQAFKQAETYFAQALERDPENIGAMIGLGAYHANMGAQVLDGESRAHRGKAREILHGVIDKAPQNSAAYHFLGLVSDMPDEALKWFEQSVELNPSNAGGHAHYGHALTRMGRPAEGLEHLRYAIRLSPRDPNLGYWLEFIGSAELRMNRYREAIENFNRSAALNPGYPRSWAGLAAAHALSGDIDEARRIADKLKTFAPQLSAEALAERFSRRKEQPLYEGLRLALAPLASPE